MTKTYRYKTKQADQKIVSGMVRADSSEEASLILARRGISAVEISLERSGKFLPSFFVPQRVSPQEKIAFLEHLADLVEAGLPIFRSLEILSRQNQNPVFAHVLKDVKESIRAGKGVSETLEKHSAIFSPFTISMVRAGEQSGTLDASLRESALALEREHELKQKVNQALVYPGIILAFGVITVTVLLFFVIPRLEEIYQDFGGTLPFLTRIFIFTSRILTRFGWLAALLAAAGAYFWHHRAKQHLKHFESLLAKIPWIGTLKQLEDTVYFSRTLGLLLKHGIPIIEALDVSARVVGSRELSGKLSEVRGKVIQGISLAHSVEELGAFDPFVQSFIETGEETGSLEKALQKVSVIYEKRLESLIKISTTLIEPVLLLAVGIVVGLFVIGMLLPIFEISLLVR